MHTQSDRLPDHNSLFLWQLRLNSGKQCLRKGSKWSGITLLLPQAGVGRCLTGSAEYPFSQGDVLVLGPSVECRLAAAEQTEVTAAGFTVLSQHLFPLVSGVQLRLVLSYFEELDRPKVYAASSPIAAECHRRIRGVPSEPSFDQRCLLLGIAGYLLEIELAKAPRSGSIRTEQQVKQILGRLSVAEIAALSVEDLAERFSCSRRQLNRIFQKHLGISVSALTMEMRLLNAGSLLRDPELKIIHIAEQCGFNHLGLFNACFKRRFGMSPSQYRKNMMTDSGKSEGSR